MWERRYSFTILNLDTRWKRVVSFTRWPLYPRGNSPLVEGWVGPRAVLDVMEKRKFFGPAGNRGKKKL
jgi:hypothetical protein